jgi:hypothetical protein
MPLLLGVVLALALQSDTGTTARPTLGIVDDMPLVVRGTGFKPREHVQVSLVLRTRSRSTRLVASLGGTFVARFTLTPIQCQLVEAVVAAGDRGSRVRMRPALLSCVRPPPQA